MAALRVRALLLLAALPAALATGATGADALGLVQTHRSVRNSSQTRSGAVPNGTARARGAARSFPVPTLTVQTLSIYVYAKKEGSCGGCFETAIEVTISGVLCRFVFHPGTSSGLARISPGFGNQNMGWSPAVGVYHLLNITVRDNDIHTYQITNGANSAQVWSKDFFLAGFYTNDASSVVVNILQGNRDILTDNIGTAYFYTRSGVHTFYMPAAVGQPITANIPFIDRSQLGDVTFSHCNAWGDPHYTTYGGTSYNYMGIGVHNFTVSPSDSFTAQVFNCPLNPNSPGISITVAIAVRFGQYVITKIGQTTKIEGVTGSTGQTELQNGNTYSFEGGVDLPTVGASYLVVRGPTTAGGYGELRVKMLGSSASPLNWLFNVYAAVPSGHVAGTAGLCSSTGPHSHVTGSAGLFNAADLATLETACYPSGSGVTPDTYDSTPLTLSEQCGKCDPAILLTEAESACTQVSSNADKYASCQFDYCSTCGDPGVVYAAVEADSEEQTGQPYTITPGALIDRNTLPSNVPFDYCSAWGDPHYTTYGGTSWDFMGIGVYEFLNSVGDQITVQIYECACTGTNVNNGGPSIVTGVAVRAGVHTVTMVGQTTKLNGTTLGVGSHSLYGGVDVTVYDEGSGYLHVQGPTSSQGYGEVRARVFTNNAISPTGYYFNVYGRIPTAHRGYSSGQCTDGSTTVVPAADVMLERTTATHRGANVAAADVKFSGPELDDLEELCVTTSGIDPGTWNPALATSWSSLCSACTPDIPAATAQSACANVVSNDAIYQGCLLDYCQSCGDAGTVESAEDAFAVHGQSGNGFGTLFPTTTTTTGAGGGAATTAPGGGGGATTTAGGGGGTTAQPHASADPHCANVKGESFDIFATGRLTMVQTPRFGRSTGRDLSVTALVRPISRRPCAPTVIKRVDVSGAWLGKRPVLTLSPGPEGTPALPAAWKRLAAGSASSQDDVRLQVLKLEKSGQRIGFSLKVRGVILKVKQRRGRNTGTDYLDMEVKGLESLGTRAGGLLGLDSHANETRPEPGCDPSGRRVALGRGEAGATEAAYEGEAERAGRLISTASAA